jgi:hypothetical protein
MQEARAAKLIAWKQRIAWLKQKLKDDPSQVDALSMVVRRLGWTSISVTGLAEQISKRKSIVERFNSIAAVTCWCHDPGGETLHN